MRMEALSRPERGAANLFLAAHTLESDSADDYTTADLWVDALRSESARPAGFTKAALERLLRRLDKDEQDESTTARDAILAAANEARTGALTEPAENRKDVARAAWAKALKLLFPVRGGLTVAREATRTRSRPSSPVRVETSKGRQRQSGAMSLEITSLKHELEGGELTVTVTISLTGLEAAGGLEEEVTLVMKPQSLEAYANACDAPYLDLWGTAAGSDPGALADAAILTALKAAVISGNAVGPGGLHRSNAIATITKLVDTKVGAKLVEAALAAANAKESAEGNDAASLWGEVVKSLTADLREPEEADNQEHAITSPGIAVMVEIVGGRTLPEGKNQAAEYVAELSEAAGLGLDVSGWKVARTNRSSGRRARGGSAAAKRTTANRFFQLNIASPTTIATQIALMKAMEGMLRREPIEFYHGPYRRDTHKVQAYLYLGKPTRSTPVSEATHAANFVAVPTKDATIPGMLQELSDVIKEPFIWRSAAAVKGADAVAPVVDGVLTTIVFNVFTEAAVRKVAVARTVRPPGPDRPQNHLAPLASGIPCGRFRARITLT